MTLLTKSELKVGDLVICNELPGFGGKLTFSRCLLPSGGFDYNTVINYKFCDLAFLPLLILNEYVKRGKYYNFKCLLEGNILFCVFVPDYEHEKWLRKIN